MIDVHTHHLLPEHWGDEFESNWRPVYGKPWPRLTPDDFDKAMADVSLAVVFGITASAAGVRTPHRVVAEFCDETRTPTIGFMALDPSDSDVMEQLDEGLELGLRGIKLYPVLAGFEPDDPAFDHFFSVAEERGLPVLWHMGATPSRAGRLALTMPLRIDEVAHRHPELRQVIAHMGHPWQLDSAIVIRKNPHVYADVSGLWARRLGGWQALIHAQEWGVVDKLLFGSDYPIWSPRDGIEGLWSLTELEAGSFPRVEPATVEAILTSDPVRALGLEDATATQAAPAMEQRP